MLAILALGTASRADNSPGKPNIVVILADDLGYGDLGCYGAAKIRTPHLDRLAQEGMRFTDAHSPSAVCTPTRYGLLTGRYCWRTKLKQGVLVGDSPLLLEPGRPTLASFLRQHGYATACIGKWHLGLGNDAPVDFARPLVPGPLTAGFETFFGIPASLDMTPYVYVENDRVEALPTAIAEPSPRKKYFEGLFWRDGPAAPGFRHAEVLPRLTARAEAFLQAQSERQPFFLYLPLTSPHTPWVPSKLVPGEAPQASDLQAYLDFVVETDAVVGRILAALEKQRLDRNTLVIVTSDNGAMWLPEYIERTGHRANGPWRGQKADIYEAGHRVPFLVRWPGQTPAGVTSRQTICLTDLFATVADILESPLPENSAEDSFSLKPVLLGQAGDAPPRSSIIHHSAQGKFAIRRGPWKAIFHLGSGGFTAPATEQAVPGGPTGQLYQLEHDPGEERNLWQDEPALVKELSSLLDQARTADRTR